MATQARLVIGKNDPIQNQKRNYYSSNNPQKSTNNQCRASANTKNPLRLRAETLRSVQTR